MVLETERLLLKDYQTDNIDDYFKLKSTSEVWTYSTFTPLTDIEHAYYLLKELIVNRKNGKYDFMALCLKDSNKFIGEAGIIGYNPSANRCVIGYNLLPEFWNQGFATEITNRIVAYAFEELGIERIEALVLQSNIASCKVLEKSGFLLEGVLRNYNKSNNDYRNVCYYGIISSDFLGKLMNNDL